MGCCPHCECDIEKCSCPGEVVAKKFEPSDTIVQARKHLFEICKDPKKFRMCIPVQKDDSDEIFGRVIDLAEKMEKELWTGK